MPPLKLRKFIRLYISKRFSCPTIIRKFMLLVKFKKQTVYEYIWNDFKERRKSYHLSKRHRKVNSRGLSRFIQFSSRRKTKHIDYVYRKMRYISKNQTNYKVHVNKTRYLSLPNLSQRHTRFKNVIKKKQLDIVFNTDQIQPNRIITRFRNLLAKKGKLFRAELLVQRVRYLVKVASLKKRTKNKISGAFLINKAFFKVLTLARPIVSLKPVKKGRNNTILKPIALSQQRATSLTQRNIIASVDGRSERLLVNRIALEFIAIYKKRPNTTQSILARLRKEVRKNYALL